MVQVAVFHPGRQHSWQTALALQQADALAWYATALFYQADRWPYRIEPLLPGFLRRPVSRYFARVACPEIDAGLVRIVGACEWAERLAARLNRLHTADRLNRLGNRRFQRGVRRRLRREPVQLVWGYDTSCADAFDFARKRGMVCVLDRSIGHPRALRDILVRERARHPAFFDGDLGVSSDSQIAEADREMALADHIVVGSSFSADTAIRSGADPSKIHIVPYGYDERLFGLTRPVRPELGRLPVRFLFVGTVSPRKGVHHLLEAFRRIPREQAVLTMVGPSTIPPAVLARYRPHVDFRGALPRAEVARQFEQAHCFIFPSLFEGGGIVLYEALASGLGVVHSRATADVVGEDGANGMRLDQVDADSIEAAVRRIIGQPDMLRGWADAAWALRSDFGWRTYRRRIADLLPTLV